MLPLSGSSSLLPSQPSSLTEVLEILSLEYGEDLKGLIHTPHHWLIVKDAETGVMGGMCLTPRTATGGTPMINDFCHKLKSEKDWVGSHLFCWVPEHLEEGAGDEFKAVSAFYGQLYTTLATFCSTIGIASIWTAFPIEQHLSALGTGLFPFEEEMPFNHQRAGYVAAFLPCSQETLQLLQQNQAVYSTSTYRNN